MPSQMGLLTCRELLPAETSASLQQSVLEEEGELFMPQDSPTSFSLSPAPAVQGEPFPSSFRSPQQRCMGEFLSLQPSLCQGTHRCSFP